MYVYYPFQVYILFIAMEKYGSNVYLTVLSLYNQEMLILGKFFTLLQSGKSLQNRPLLFLMDQNLLNIYPIGELYYSFVRKRALVK